MPIQQSEALTRLRDRLDDPGTATPETTGTWRNPQLRRYLNEAQRELARRSEALRLTSTVAATAGVSTYPAPADMVRLEAEGVEFTPDGDTAVYVCEYRDRANLNRIWPPRRSGSGYPLFWTLNGYPGGSAEVELWPAPPVDGTITFRYYGFPPDLPTDTTAGSSYLIVPAGWEDVLLDYAEYRAYLQVNDPNMANIALNRYRENLSALAESATRYVDSAGEIIYDPYYSVGEEW